ncbi:hypothetical protein PG993_007995 [Apiospora rasikravindrae]|uniref:Uncharacterized protein n=1 Tax=Apiospora rasikravindrae TaxID=990691 RepID=A0ABR1SZ36_9PEZI
MAPNRWTQEKNEALLNSFGKALLKTATANQKTLIEDHMREAGFDGTTWEAVRWAGLATTVIFKETQICAAPPANFHNPTYLTGNIFHGTNPGHALPAIVRTPSIRSRRRSNYLPTDLADMSQYAPKTMRKAYVTWDSDMHEDILVAFINYFKPTKLQYEEIHRIVMEMGHRYSSGALRLVFHHETVLVLSSDDRALPLQYDLRRRGLQQHWGSFLFLVPSLLASSGFL